MVSQLQVFRHQAWEGEVISPHVELGGQAMLLNLKRILTSGDARWYLDISENGYDFSDPEIGKMRNWVFFPLVPLLYTLLSAVVGSKIISGLLISNICFLLFLRTLQGICQEERFSDEQTENILWLTAFFPTSYFFSMPLTESVFALFLSASFLNLRRGEFLISSLLLALATLTRPTGILILPAFFIALLLYRKQNLKSIMKFFLPAAFTLLALASYYFFNTGDLLAFVHNQVYWDRNGSVFLLLDGLSAHFRVLMTGWNFTTLHFLTLIIAICTVVSSIRRKEFDFAAMVFLPLAAALNTGTMISLTRIAMPLFPIIFFISRVSINRRIEKGTLATFAMLLGIMTLLFALHVTSAMA